MAIVVSHNAVCVSEKFPGLLAQIRHLRISYSDRQRVPTNLC